MALKMSTDYLQRGQRCKLWIRDRDEFERYTRGRGYNSQKAIGEELVERGVYKNLNSACNHLSAALAGNEPFSRGAVTALLEMINDLEFQGAVFEEDPIQRALNLDEEMRVQRFRIAMEGFEALYRRTGDPKMRDRISDYLVVGISRFHPDGRRRQEE